MKCKKVQQAMTKTHQTEALLMWAALISQGSL